MSSRKRKQFSELSRWQKLRRIKKEQQDVSNSSVETAVQEQQDLSNSSIEAALQEQQDLSNSSVEAALQEERVLSNSSVETALQEQPDLSNSSVDYLLSDNSGNFSIHHSSTASIEYPNEPTSQYQCFRNCDEEFTETLKIWANTEQTLSNDCLSRLLSKLNKKFPAIPKTAKALKQITTDIDINPLGDHGEYVHFTNWVQSCSLVADSINCVNLEKLTLAINIDGIPLYNNSKLYSAYPILVKFLEADKIICAGLYCTNTTDKLLPSPDIFLNSFINDLLVLQHDGLDTKFGNLSIEIGPFICDAPMRSYLKQIISHSGYYSCERCKQKGEYWGGHVALLETNSSLRTDETFKLKADFNHHLPDKTSPLQITLNFPMVTHFVLDYMHLTCIGVMKRLLLRWKSSKQNQKKCHLSRHQKVSLENVLVVLSKHVPSDFPRKFESGYQHISYWKASEYRLMMLYIGSVLFAHNFFPKDNYKHFLKLLVSMRILLTEGMSSNITVVQDILKSFIEDSKVIYGNSIISYNIHSLLHLPDDYILFGNLENISAFPFESYLGTHIKRSVRSGFKPLHQIARHVIAHNLVEVAPKLETYPVLMRKIKNVSNDDVQHFLKVTIKDKVVVGIGGLGSRDNNILFSDGTIGIVRSIFTEKNEKNVFIKVQKFSWVSPFFENPINSTSIGIYKVDKLQPISTVPVSDISFKMMLLPFKNHFVAITLIHGATASN
jgi:hypothetical protein